MPMGLRLFDLVTRVSSLDNTLKIYIHTWNVYSNNISWRRISDIFYYRLDDIINKNIECRHPEHLVFKISNTLFHA
jgi:hypothetical protein